MNIGELKKSLSRFSSDMDDSEIVMTYMNNGKDEYDNLAFVAYTEMEDTTCIVLGSMSSAVDRMKKGTLKYPDGSKPSDQGYNITE